MLTIYKDLYPPITENNILREISKIKYIFYPL
jgi:hypothetical protein